MPKPRSKQPKNAYRPKNGPYGWNKTKIRTEVHYTYEKHGVADGVVLELEEERDFGQKTPAVQRALLDTDQAIKLAYDLLSSAAIADKWLE